MVAGLYGTFQLQKRLRPVIAENRSLQPGAKVLVRTILFFVTVVPIMNAVLGYLAGGSRNPAWWASADLSNPYVLAHFLSLVAFMCVALWWAWAADGPRRLLKYRDAFVDASRNPLTLGPEGLKWFITLIAIGFLIVRVGLLFVKHAG